MMGCLSRSISFREAIRTAAALIALSLLAPYAFAQGFLLVAKPLMTDPNFERTVVLAVGSEDGRTTGFVLNRPFNRSLAQILPRNPVLSKFTEPLFNGGPVEPEGLFALYRGAKPKGTAVAASEKLHLAMDPATVETLMNEPQTAVRFYNGYAGWGPGQLQNEIDRGGWWRLELDEEIIFRKDTSKLWHDLEQRTKRMTAQRARHAPSVSGADRESGFQCIEGAPMQRSERRILTTHVGSLPRNPALRDSLIRQERGEAIDREEHARLVASAVDRVVAKQIDAGIDIGNDGEQPRVGFSTYVAQRMRGFGGESKRPPALDLLDHPDYAEMLAQRRKGSARVQNAPQCIAPVQYVGEEDAKSEGACFAQAINRAKPRAFTETFMTAASPGVAACILLNAHYASHEAYVDALAAELRKEYEIIHADGHLLQIDAPDLAMERPRLFQRDSLDRFLEIATHHVSAINRATANIPRERIRLHVCWGNYDGPHTHDVALEPLLPILYQAKVGALSLEMGNPRHQHEWKAIKRNPPPEHMLLLPGVIDSTSNYVEHPEVVSDRICQVVDAIGDRTRVIASVDCGFGTFAGTDMVADSVVWAKLATLAEGARKATRRLWG